MPDNFPSSCTPEATFNRNWISKPPVLNHAYSIPIQFLAAGSRAVNMNTLPLVTMARQRKLYIKVRHT